MKPIANGDQSEKFGRFGHFYIYYDNGNRAYSLDNIHFSTNLLGLKS